MSLKFDWRNTADKAARNFCDHGVSFDLATTVFDDPFAVERLDDREDYGEERFILIGIAAGNSLLSVVYTERKGRIRIISARRATKREQDDYFQQNN